MNKPSSLLAFRIAGIPLAVPAESVASILMPPTQLTHPPGSRSSTPGIFHHAGQVHSVIDLHPRLGITKALGESGRLLLHEQQGRRYAFRVDTIIGLIAPEQGQWAALPPYLPHKLFWSGFLYREEIMLCTELETLRQMHDASPLRQHLQQQQATRDTTRPSETIAPEPSPGLSSPPDQQTSTAGPPPAIAAKPTSSTTGPRAQTPPMASPEQHRTVRTTPATTPARQSTPSKSAPLPPPRPSPARSTGSGKIPAKKPVTARPADKASPRPYPQQISRQASAQITDPQNMVQAPLPICDTPQPGNALPWAILGLILLGSSGTGLWWLFSPDHTPDHPVHAHPAPSPASPPAPLWQPAAPTTAMPVPEPVPEARPDPIPETMPAPIASAMDDPAPSGTGQTAAALRLERDNDGILNLIIERQPQTDIPVEGASDLLARSESAPSQIDVTQAEDMPAESPGSDAATVVVDATPETDTLPPQPPGPMPAAELKLDEALWLDQSSIPLAPCQCEHIVVRGDTLWSIAMRYTGNAFNYPLLARQSGIDNPDLIYPGNRIRITIR